MLTLAHTSDLHVCEHLRPADLIVVLNAFLADVKAQAVDLIVIAGDLFDRRSTPEERIVLAEFLQEAASIAGVFIVKGNHDVAGDLTIFGRLETHLPLVVMDRPTLPEGARVHGRFGIIALPWADKSHFVSHLDAGVDSEKTRLMTIEAMETLLVGLHAEASRLRAEGFVPILVSHLMVAGSVTSTGQVMQGVGIELTPYAIQEIGCEYAALGHVHKSQSWFDGRVSYSGSPVRQNFGESEPKGYNLVSFNEDGSFAGLEFRPLPAREILLLEADWTQTAGQGDAICTPGQLAEIKGALVRFRYRIGAGQLHTVDEDTLRRFLLDHGAAEVKLEAVVQHETRVRSESIGASKSIADKLQAYFDAKGMSITPEQQARLADKVTTIEREG